MSKILEGLNAAQKAAVVGYDAPSLIIAGAGSGKTRVLTSRIAYMLEQGVAPHSILALTFTNKAAKEMRERMWQLVDPQLTRYISMGTFHSVFARILRENAEVLGYPSSFTIFQPSDAKSLIKTILKELNLSDDTYKPNAVLSRISLAKNSLITAAAYSSNVEFVAEDRSMRMPHFGQVYSMYCSRCKASGAMDFDDLLLQTNILFKDFPEVLARYQERYKYILVDEFQDTNYAQYIIIRRLSMLHGKVCVVGDDAQSIYAFRGAKIENILNFKNHFPQTQVFKLEQNYRSTQTIVDAANSLIAHNGTKIDKKCFSAGVVGEKIRVVRAFTDRDEANIVVEMMQDRMREGGLTWDDFVILYRNNSQSQAMENALRQRYIPYQIYKGNSFYEHKEIKDMLAYIRLVVNPRDDEAFKRIINYPKRGIGDTTVAKIELLAREKGTSMWDMADYIIDVPPQDATQRAIVRKIKEFVELIRELSAYKSEMTLYDFGALIANRSGILPALRALKLEGEGAVANIEELLNTMQLFNEQVDAEIRAGERDETLEVSIDEWLQNVMLLTDQDNSDDQGEKVTLMTVHSSKGLEYKYVYIVGVEQNLFPSQRAVEMGDIEEERRLFYVAITRAKCAATISFCDMRFKWGNMEFSSPSNFIREIDPKYVDTDEDIQALCGGGRSRKVNDGETLLERNERSGGGFRENPNSRSNDRYSARAGRGEGDAYRGGSGYRMGERVDGSRERAIEQLRKEYDYRHKKQQERNSVRGMRSLGVRQKEDAQSNASGNPFSQIPPKPTGETASTKAKFEVNDRIFHERFGRGRIIGVDKWNSSEMLKIDFENFGVKSIIADYAPIKHI